MRSPPALRLPAEQIPGVRVVVGKAEMDTQPGWEARVALKVATEVAVFTRHGPDLALWDCVTERSLLYCHRFV